MTEPLSALPPQMPREHYVTGYDSQKRWSSYWYQIDWAMRFERGRCLEVGIGNGLVSEYLRNVGGRAVTTVDFDPALNADVVGDIAALPFKDGAFECALACEVLEHMPFERSSIALGELRRVARHCLISVPDTGLCLQAGLAIGRKTRRVQVTLPWLKRAKTVGNPGEHYWELEVAGYPAARLQQAISVAGWRVTRDFRNPAHPFHHFFVLE